MKAVYISLDVKLTGQRIHDVMKEQGYSVRQLQEKLDLTCPHAVYNGFMEAVFLQRITFTG